MCDMNINKINGFQDSDIIVSIKCLVYNHEPYLRQCLDGFIMQKTNFKFEAIVHDDASKDGSAAIIKEYADKYPDIIKPIFETENQYSKHDGSLRKIMDAHIRGKYIAYCEGDDYWIDPNKLQKQVDFLETHPEYTMCFHNAIEYYENSDQHEKLFSNIKNRSYSGGEIYNKWIVPTASTVFAYKVIKSKIYEKVSSMPGIKYGDTPLFLCAAEEGLIYGMKDIMSVYRRHPDGLVLSSSLDDKLSLNEHDMAIYKCFGNKYKKIAFHNICKRCIYLYINMDKKYKKKYNNLLSVAFSKDLFYSIIYIIYAFLKYKFIRCNNT